MVAAKAAVISPIARDKRRLENWKTPDIRSA
jgi:hypothetical protein